MSENSRWDLIQRLKS